MVFPAGWYGRFRGLIHELGKFGLVGVLGYAVDVGISNLLFTGLSVGPLTSKVASTAAAATVSYAANRNWTWRHRAHTGLAREYGLFLALSVVGLVITLGCIWVSRDVLGLRGVLAYNISGNVIGLGLGTAWRFWSFKKWVFLPVEIVAAAHDDAIQHAPV